MKHTIIIITLLVASYAYAATDTEWYSELTSDIEHAVIEAIGDIDLGGPTHSKFMKSERCYDQIANSSSYPYNIWSIKITMVIRMCDAAYERMHKSTYTCIKAPLHRTAKAIAYEIERIAPQLLCTIKKRMADYSIPKCPLVVIEVNTTIRDNQRGTLSLKCTRVTTLKK